MFSHMCEYVLVIQDVPHISQRVDGIYPLYYGHMYQLYHIGNQHTLFYDRMV